MNTSPDFVAQSALRSIRASADLAITHPVPTSSHVPDSFLGLSPQEIRDYSMGRLIKTLYENRGWGTSDSLERRCAQLLEKKIGPTKNALTIRVPYEVSHRALNVSTAAAGGYLVDTVNVGFIELLRRRTLAYRLGATPLPGLKSNVGIPKLAGGATAGPLSTETTQISETDDTFGQLALSPKSYGAYTEVSRLLMLQSSPAIELVVSNDLTKAGAVAIDDGFFNGPGSAGKVLGAFNVPGISTTSGTSFAWATAQTMVADVLDANIPGERLAFVAHPDTAKLLAGRQKFAGSNDTLWMGNIKDGSLAGLPAASSVTIPSGTVALIDFAEGVIGEWGNLEIAVDPFTKFTTGVVGIRAMWAFDVGFGHPAAICTATSVT
jgi:HK97 family phage major capsid protein